MYHYAINTYLSFSNTVTFPQKNVNILCMRNDLSAPILIGAIVAIGSFFATMASFYHDNFLESGYGIVWVSLIIGPTAMVSSMLGYAAWWFAKFLIALVSKQNRRGSGEIDGPPDK